MRMMMAYIKPIPKSARYRREIPSEWMNSM
jgi:hypothetical protein